MSKTPGPWIVWNEGEDRLHVWSHGSSEQMICDCGNKNENTSSNANLIAAAPDLLAALKQMVDAALLSDWNVEGEATSREHEACMKARVAIAKAEGK